MKILVWLTDGYDGFSAVGPRVASDAHERTMYRIIRVETKSVDDRVDRVMK